MTIPLSSHSIIHHSDTQPPHPVNKHQTVKVAFERSLDRSKHAPGDSFAPSADRATAHARSIKPTTAAAAAASSSTTAAVSGTAPTVLRTRVAPEHEHWLTAFFVQLFEK